MKLLRQIAIQFGVTFVALALLFTLGAPALQRFEGQPAIRKAIYTLGFAGEAYAITPDYEVDGNADDVQVQQALNALPVTGGKLVLYAGNWKFNATVSRAINNVTIEGDGKGTYLANNAATAIFSAGAQTGWFFKDLRTDAGGITMGTDTLRSNVWIGTTLYGKNAKSDTITVSSSDSRDRFAADFIADGTADDVEIQAALNALPYIVNGKKGRVYLEEGRYNITQPITLTLEQQLVGAGVGTVLVATTNLTSMIFTSNTVSNSGIYIADLVLYGNANAGYTVTLAMSLSNLVNSTIERVTIYELKGGGIGLAASSLGSSTLVTLNDIYAVSSNFTGQTLGVAANVTDVLVLGGSYDYGTGMNIQASGAVRIQSSDICLSSAVGITVSTPYLMISDSTIGQNGSAGILYAQGAAADAWAIISNNQFYGNTSQDIYLSKVTGATITGNVLRSTGSAQSIYSDAASNYVVFVGNVIHGTINLSGANNESAHNVTR